MDLKNSKTTVALGGILLVALVVNFGLAIKLGIAKPMVSDAEYFLEAAQSLAAGDGYRVKGTFWPGEPSMRRFPGWPAVVSLALRVTPGLPPDAVMRSVALCVNSGVAVAIAWLTLLLFGKGAKSDHGLHGRHGSGSAGGRRAEDTRHSTPDTRHSPFVLLAAIFAGLAYVLYPAALFNAQTGLSEPLFVLVVLLGAIALVKGNGVSGVGCRKSGDREVCPLPEDSPKKVSGLQSAVSGLLGFLLLGCATLIRGNFLLWLPLFAVLLLASRIMKRILGLPSSVLCPPSSDLRLRIALTLACIVLFLLPSSLWALRNYRVCGHFPVLSTLGGQTFYGANNDVVANDLEWWGYWVFPDSIPGETTMRELSQTMSEYEVHDHYMRRGKSYVLAHWLSMPRLLLGKVIRAYVPMPWRPRLGSYAVAGYRWMLMAGVVAGLVCAWRWTPGRYRLMLGAMVLTNVTTVLVFYGSTRFAFALEPFFFPFVGAGVACSLSLMGKPQGGHKGRKRGGESTDKI